jgi:hypothetical protein
MSKFFKGDVTNGVVELNLLDPAAGGGGGASPTIVTRNTGPNDVTQVVGDISSSDGFQVDSTVKGLVIGTSCTSIGDYSFYFGDNLTGDLVIPDSVTSIGSGAFYFCSGLTSLTIGNSVTSIGEFAFISCSSVTALYTNTPAASWVGSNALLSTPALVNIYEGPDVTGQYSATFQGGSGMTVSAWTNYPNIP